MAGAVGGDLGQGVIRELMWLAVTARDGRVSWWAVVRTEEEALAAVGLRE